MADYDIHIEVYRDSDGEVIWRGWPSEYADLAPAFLEHTRVRFVRVPRRVAS